MNFYHGTSLESANKILKEGFSISSNRNWKVQSRPGFVYFSTAYAPFFATFSNPRSHKKALIKIKVNGDKLYPDDDFIMYAHEKSIYTQEDIDSINIEEFRYLTIKSIMYLGCACAKLKDVEIVGIQEFDSTNLITYCDPCITPVNYQILGEYYRQLSDVIYEGKDYIKWAQEYNKTRMSQIFNPQNK